MNRKSNYLTTFAMIGMAVWMFFILYNDSDATSQWSRQYEVACSTCHSAFPRLNYYGEQFLRNGYQLPDEQDGDEAGKEDLGGLNLGSLDNIFGLRVNVQPVKIEEKKLITNGGTDTTAKISIGRPPWLQLFTAGSIFKNTSIFIETQIDTEDGAHSSWFRLGFHNLFGPQGAANIRVGQLSPMEWASISGRLRMIPSLKIHAISNVKSSNGKGDDAVPLASAQPGFEFYGFRGPVGYSAGILSGKRGTDVNKYKNLFGTFRLESTSGKLEGSSISLWGYYGHDTKIGNDATSINDEVNDFWRVSPAFNLRYQELDLIGALFFGKDDNWTLLDDANKVENKFTGAVVQAGYFFDPQVYGVLQFDWVDSDDFKTIKHTSLAPSLWFFPRENMRVGITAEIDLLDEDAFHPVQANTYDITIRSMF